MTPEEKYKEIERLFKRLSDEMCRVVQSFYIWESLVFSRSIIEAGEEQAKKNVEIMSFHKDFFNQTEDSHLTTFIIGISKFYDRNPKSLTLNTIIEKMREYQKDITAETLMNVYPNRFNKEELRFNYKSFDERDINGIDVLWQDNKRIADNLRAIRNKRIAHNNIELIEITFVPKEVEKFIGDTQEIFNKLQGRFSEASTTWNHMKEDAERDTSTLLENLIRGEKQRKDEIKRQYNS